MGISMKCRDFEKLMPYYFTDTLNESELRGVIEHLEHCESCKEELVIHLLLTEGMQRLEEGSSFDVQEELKATYNRAVHRIRFSRRMRVCRYFLEAFEVMLVFGILIYLAYL